MSAPASDRQSIPTVPNPSELVAQTAPFAAQTFKAVAEHYLEFRRVYYHEAQPTLSTVPPAHAEIHQAEIARLAESTLRLLPQAVKSLPLVGPLIDHLQQVADLHSISEDERSSLHNMTMSFLHGTRGGIQPWYVEWLLASAHNLARISHPEYYFTYPWDGLIYRSPADLAAFDLAVRSGDIAAIKREIQRLANGLIAALRDPMGAQADLAFTGQGGERRQRIFRLKTAAALALGAYLVAEEVRILVRPRVISAPPQSALAPLPQQLAARVLGDGASTP